MNCISGLHSWSMCFMSVFTYLKVKMQTVPSMTAISVVLNHYNCVNDRITIYRAAK